MNRSAARAAVTRFARALLLAAVLFPSGRALALERDGYSMEILVGGTTLTEYAARSTNYVEARKGSEYSVRLRNRTGQRIAIALSVDGLNSIDARTTSASEARKWVLDPYETITIDGWQTSSMTARRFFFTTEERSYGNWLGRTKNLGIVAAAVFRERLPQPIAGQLGEIGGAAGSRSKDERGAQEPPSGAAPEKRAMPARPDDLAATGIGQETNHPVHRVSFDAEDSPSAVLEIRYEYRDSLVRLGVLPPDGLCEGSLMRREQARGFDEPQYAPDPYRRRNR